MEIPETQQKILNSAKRWFLEKGFKSAPLRKIVNDVGFTLGAFYGYYKNKEELFYELTDGAADGLKKLILRLKDKRFDLHTGQREYQMLLTEEVISLLLAEKYGLLLIMEQAHGTRYESLRESMIDMLAAKTMPLLADEDNCLLLAQIMARNLLDGTVQVLKTRIRPREVRTGLNRLVEYHTKGINALLK